MRYLKLIVLFYTISLTSCKCSYVNWQTISEMIATNPKILNFLSSKQLLVVENIESIDLYTISPQLIEGTTDEYSNKSFLVKTLDETEIKNFLNHVLKDDNYDWDAEKKVNFNPNIQYVLKGAENQFLMLYSTASKQIGIIDIEGQETHLVKPELDNYFKNN
jgi:hypothetical protein